MRAADLDLGADPSGKTRIWLALEALQVTGSFKVRGALTSLARYAAQPGNRATFVAASAGNHGAGVAYAASVLGLDATVVMPRTVPQAKRGRVEAYGAEIVLAPSDHYDDAEAHAIALAKDRGAVFVSPYDDDAVVAGNGGSLGFEIVRAIGGVPDKVLAPFGGGGLATGLAWALADESTEPGEPGGHPRAVWGVQSEASPAMAMSLEQGRAVERFIPEGPTLAEGLEGGISGSAFERARGAIAGVVVVSETSIGRTMAHAYREMGLILEGSAAAALVPVLSGLPEPLRGADASGIDLVVVLTGRNVDRSRLEGVFAESGTSQADVRSRLSEAGE